MRISPPTPLSLLPTLSYPPLSVIAEHQAELPVGYQFKYSSVYMSIPNSLTISPHPQANHKF